MGEGGFIDREDILEDSLETKDPLSDCSDAWALVFHCVSDVEERITLREVDVAMVTK